MKLTLLAAAASCFSALSAPLAAMAQQAPIEVSIPSGGETVSARLLIGEGEGDRPAIALFNGFPSGSNVPRVAGELQAAGYTVLVPSYRGTGASGGEFSLDNARVDGQAVVDWLRHHDGIDPDQVAVFGVSFGGWLALHTAASDADIRCVVALVPADMGVIADRWGRDPEYAALWRSELDSFAADPELARFGAGGPGAFMQASIAGAEEARFSPKAAALADRPVFVAGGRSDPAAPFTDHYGPLVAALRAAEVPFAALEFPGGHNPNEAKAAAVSFIERSCFAG